MTSVHGVLAHLREAATSESDEENMSERLVHACLRTDPVWADQFSDVWTWGEWPGNAGEGDTGIDLAITLSGIPPEAYRNQLGSRSAIEWITDRYEVKTDKASGIVNDPNDWSRGVSEPRCIIRPFACTVSMETMDIVDALPDLVIRADQNPA